jgi:predicted ATP-grasp superfamily ATP-dependent carboligase
MGKRSDHRSVIFPTRDDDLIFLDEFREQLSPYYRLTIPEREVVKASLDKWETYQWAQRAQVPAPKCWRIEGEKDLARIAPELTYPCVLKPVAAHHWRRGGNWELVGGRKAICAGSWEELVSEYASASRADKRVLVQEMIPGGDDSLWIAACYLDQDSKFVAGFNTQKLVQFPETFGTGCIVQAVDRPELFEPTVRLLQGMGFTGIAEVEYKWDQRTGEYRLIEINPRAWDQHRLGKACGVDLVWLCYCEHAGLPMPPTRRQVLGHKWIAEDTFLIAALCLARRPNSQLSSLFRLARGQRIYAIWSSDDPFPFVGYGMQLMIEFARFGPRFVWSAFRRLLRGNASLQQKGLTYERHFGKKNAS